MSIEIIPRNTKCYVQIEGENERQRGIIGCPIWMGNPTGWLYEIQLEDGRQLNLPTHCISIVTSPSEAAKFKFEFIEQIETSRITAASISRTYAIGNFVKLNKREATALLSKYNIDILYYMACTEHASSILADGIFCRNAALKEGLMVSDFSNQSVQWYRGKRNFPKLNKNTHDFVPLYFCLDTPMRYVLLFGTEKNSTVIPPREIVFFELSALDIIMSEGVIICDGNAGASTSSFFSDIQTGFENLDWTAIKKPLIKDKPDYFYNKRKKQAEVLVPAHIPTTAIKRVVTCNDEVTQYIKDKYVTTLQFHAKSGKIEITAIPEYFMKNLKL